MLRWGVASIGITLLSMAHLIRDNISGAGQAPEAVRVKKAGLWLCDYFCKFVGVNPFGMY